MRRRVHTKRSAQAAKHADLDAVAKAFSGFRPASTVLTAVRAVPTCMVGFDHGTRVGGLPTERITLIHGPSGEGKTYFTLGLVRSFLALSFPALFIDAERTTPEGFVRLALGPHAGSPYFFAERPTTYEDTRVKVRNFCNRVKELRAKGVIAKDAVGLIIVDSIRKLVPAEQWKRILELEKNAKADEKARDRTQQIKAMMNAAWCDELIPLLEQTGCTMGIIAREADDPDAPPPRAMPGRPPPPKKKKTLGGSALYYDASLDCEITRAAYVSKPGKEGERPVIYGEKHRITIKKSKVAGKDDRTTICFFHTSNGLLSPEGFDRARDVLELARTFGIVGSAKPKKKGKDAPEKKGKSTWLAWNGNRWQGEHAAVKALSSKPEVLDTLEALVRAKIRTVKPMEINADGEIISE